jgi:hypothetical protein
MWKSFAVLLVLIFAVVTTNTAGAISFESRNFDALAVEADQIVIGTVASTNSRRTGAREIVTDFRFADLDVIKGAVANGTLTMTLLGGTVGTDTLTVAGAPTFHPGIRYLVFVSGNGSVMFPLVGGDQGIFQIRKDVVSGVSRVHDYAGRALTRLPGRADSALVDSLNPETGAVISEAVFVDAIRATLNAKAAQ